MTERSWVQMPHWGDNFSGTIRLDQNLRAKRNKRMFQPTLHCSVYFNPANGRVSFEDGWLTTNSYITKDEHETCQMTRSKVQKSIILTQMNISNLQVFLFKLNWYQNCRIERQTYCIKLSPKKPISTSK